MTPDPASLDGQINEILEELRMEEKYTAKYAQMVDQLAKLYALKELEKPKRVSPDAVLAVAANLTGILLVLNYEHAHVLTSKAMSFIRPKI